MKTSTYALISLLAVFTHARNLQALAVPDLRLNRFGTLTSPEEAQISLKDFDLHESVIENEDGKAILQELDEDLLEELEDEELEEVDENEEPEEVDENDEEPEEYNEDAEEFEDDNLEEFEPEVPEVFLITAADTTEVNELRTRRPIDAINTSTLVSTMTLERASNISAQSSVIATPGNLHITATTLSTTNRTANAFTTVTPAHFQSTGPFQNTTGASSASPISSALSSINGANGFKVQLFNNYYDQLTLYSGSFGMAILFLLSV